MISLWQCLKYENILNFTCIQALNYGGLGGAIRTTILSPLKFSELLFILLCLVYFAFPQTYICPLP